MNRPRHEHPEDQRVSDLYRTGASEQPSTDTDETILAAARREAGAGPRSFRSSRPPRWMVPASVAAVLALTVGLSLVARHELEPDRASLPAAPAVREAPMREQAPAADRSSPEPAASAPESMRFRGSPAAKKAAEAPANSAGVAAPTEAVPQPGNVPGETKPLAPEEWLQRILQLRKEGRVKEASESLQEFRRQYPDYKLPDSLR